MLSGTTVAQLLVRFAGIVLIILGVFFWAGSALSLVPLHMTLGFILVIGLWTLAGLGAAAKVSPGLLAGAALWGFVVIGFGMTQRQLMPGAGHWVIQVLHLVVGMAAMGMSEAIAKRIRASRIASSAGMTTGRPRPAH
jgi:hypothetical protein